MSWSLPKALVRRKGLLLSPVIPIGLPVENRESVIWLFQVLWDLNDGI